MATVHKQANTRAGVNRDRRHEPRIGHGVLMTFVDDGGEDTEVPASGYAHNVSRSGASLYTRERLSPGQRLRLRIPVESEGIYGAPTAEVHGFATVLRVRPLDAVVQAVALRFDETLSADSRLTAFITRL